MTLNFVIKILSMKTKLFPEIETTINSLDVTKISKERKETVAPLIDYLKAKTAKNEPIALNFICTHNSRRSHLSQIWAQVMATYFGLENVQCYSGGTEATAMYPVVGETLKNQGFAIEKLSEGDNPVYSIKYADNEHPIIAFSKKFGDVFNPKNKFGAIMTCSSADQGCPFVAGAEKRIPITYIDPKVSDGTPQQAETYKERSVQIATEMKYIFSQIN